jgi:ATP-dependent DNA helicase DinG
MTTDRDLLLVRPWVRPGRHYWLALDLLSGDRVHHLKAPDMVPPACPGAIIVSEAHGDCRELPGDSLFVPEGVLWSLLDPLRAAPVPDEDQADQVAVEAALRAAARRFRERIAWWRKLPGDLRQSCRQTLQGRQPDLGLLLALFDTAPVPPDAGQERELAADVTVPREPVAPLDPDPEAVFRWLGDPEGLGRFYGPEFHPRTEQAEMGREVAGALVSGQALMIEAGTGVGKTLAYLAPLVASITAREARAVVSTHTRALQSQILDQDLPRLRPLLGDRRFALLMGSRNYLCLRQRMSYLSRPLENTADALRAVAFRLWLEATSAGMRDELADHPLLSDDVGPLFDAPDLCLPGQCYDGDRCFVQNARRRAREADLLVVNHALLLADQKQGHTLIGDVDFLVVDEAHRLPAVTLEATAVACGPWRLGEVEDLVGRASGPLGQPERVLLAAARLTTHGPEGEKAAASCEDFGRSAKRVFDAFGKWWSALGARVDEVLPPSGRGPGRIRVRDKDEAFACLRTETLALLEELSEASGAFARLAGHASVLDDLAGGLEDDLAQLAQAGQLLRLLHAEVDFLMNDPDEDWVTWVDPSPRRGLRRLGATLLEAGGVLRDFWLNSRCQPVMTSATLAVGEDFSHMLDELGLSRRRPPTMTSVCPSPFNFHEQCLVLTPAHFPDPGAPHFGRAVGEVIRDLAQGMPRKIMGLFTSYRMIGDAAEVLAQAGLGAEPSVAGSPAVLAQTPRSGTGALLGSFRRHPRAVLLGTSTFWEGVDFPGEDLEILVVTKLPFLVPNDPWVEARCEKVAAAGENPFTYFMVRDAVLRLRQGFGRLIRRTSDRGVVIILDNRLHTKNYGTTFLSALPVIPASFGDNADLLKRVHDFFRGTNR